MRKVLARIVTALAVAVSLVAVAFVVASALGLGGAELPGAVAIGTLAIVGVAVTAMLLAGAVSRRRRERDALEAEVARLRAVIASNDRYVTHLSHVLEAHVGVVADAVLELAPPVVHSFDAAVPRTSLSSVWAGDDVVVGLIDDVGALARVVDDLVVAGQLEHGTLALGTEDVVIGPSIERVIEPFVRGGASITFCGTGDVAQVDRRRFEHVMRNLVSNAVVHGGPNVEIFTEFGGNTVSVFVIDDGDGLPDGALAVSPDRPRGSGESLLAGSAGLGLAVARGLALGMGGSLAYTRAGGLTSFVFKVPSHRVGRLNERVDDQSLGTESAAQSASEVAKLFAR